MPSGESVANKSPTDEPRRSGDSDMHREEIVQSRPKGRTAVTENSPKRMWRRFHHGGTGRRIRNHKGSGVGVSACRRIGECGTGTLRTSRLSSWRLRGCSIAGQRSIDWYQSVPGLVERRHKLVGRRQRRKGVSPVQVHLLLESFGLGVGERRLDAYLGLGDVHAMRTSWKHILHCASPCGLGACGNAQVPSRSTSSMMNAERYQRRTF